MDRVDVHSHWYPEAYLDVLRARRTLPMVRMDRYGVDQFVIFDGESGRPISDDFFDLRRKLEFMESEAIDCSVLSLGNPWLDPFAGDEGESLAVELNARFAHLDVDTTGRLRGMAVLPGGDIDAVVRTIERIGKSDHLYGTIISSRLCGFALDDPSALDAWAALEQLGRPVFVHPHYGVGGDGFGGIGAGHALPVGMAFPFETSLAVARMVFRGLTVRMPNLKLTVAHAGGTLAFLAGRLDAAWRSDPSLRAQLPVLPSTEFRRLFVDALAYHRRALAAAIDLVGSDHVGYGTDHPFSIADPKANVSAVYECVMGDEIANIFGKAAKLWYGL